VQDDALIARAAHQTGWRLNGEPGLENSLHEENLENQSAFHGRSVLDWKQHTTRDEFSAKENIDSPASRAILHGTSVQPEQTRCECITNLPI
jgi:membrane-bound lytic murein transglycosylase B